MRTATPLMFVVFLRPCATVIVHGQTNIPKSVRSKASPDTTAESYIEITRDLRQCVKHADASVLFARGVPERG